MCQYHNNIIKATVLKDVDGKGSGIVHVCLKENITVYGVTNLPHVYSPGWSELLRVSMNLQTFNDIDSLVLGHFNTFKESINSTFMPLMQNLTARTDADFERIHPEVELRNGRKYWKVYSPKILILVLQKGAA
jgi:hypothetical protein